MRLIDADTLRDKKKQAIIIDYEKYGCEVVEFIEIVNTPTIDAVPVVHGRWEEKDMFTRYHWMHNCSVCGNPVYDKNKLYHYCPSCGAKMDLEVDVCG